MTTSAVSWGPLITTEQVVFRLPDPDGAFAGVGLVQEIRRPRDWTAMVKPDGSSTWELAFARPDVGRMEYQFKGVHRDGRDEVFCDPGNPLRVPGVFGDRSVVEFDDYRRPQWLSDEPLGGELWPVRLPSRVLHAELSVQLWTSRGADAEDPLPLLVAHDGPEYQRFSSLLGLLDRMTGSGRLPPLRAALLEPVDRNETYSASALYARALATEILPALQWLAPTPPGRNQRIGMGASLGALATLHASWARPATFGGLFLQSGSFFRQRYDAHESGFGRFRRISRFVGEVLGNRPAGRPMPVTMTCGRVEENLANNRAVAAALQRQGYDVKLIVNRDAHNYVGWRDTFDPHLVDLLAKVWA